MVRYHKKNSFKVSNFLGLIIVINIRFTLLYTLFCVMILQLQNAVTFTTKRVVFRGCGNDIWILAHGKSKQTKANLNFEKKSWHFWKIKRKWVSVHNFQHIYRNRLKHRNLNQTMTNPTVQDYLQFLARVQNQRRIQVNNFQKVPKFYETWMLIMLC